MRDSICQWLFLSWNCLWNYIAHCCLCWWHFCHACIWMLWSDVGLLCAFNQTQSRCWGLGLKWQCADSLQCTGSSCIQRIWQLILAGRQCVSKPTSYQIAFSLDALLSCLCFEKKKKKKEKKKILKIVMTFNDAVRFIFGIIRSASRPPCPVVHVQWRKPDWCSSLTPQHSLCFQSPMAEQPTNGARAWG